MERPEKDQEEATAVATVMVEGRKDFSGWTGTGKIRDVETDSKAKKGPGEIAILGYLDTPQTRF